MDFTGGVGDRKDLRNKEDVEKGFFKRILHDYSMNTLMGCSIHVSLCKHGQLWCK